MPSKGPSTPKKPKTSDPESLPTTKESKQALEVAAALRSIRIRVLEDDNIVMPSDIRELITNIVGIECSTPPSPASKEALIQVLSNRKENERTLVAKLSKLLTEANEHENEVAGVKSGYEQNWETNCVPILEGSRHELIKFLEESYSTPTPRPDITYGYKFGMKETKILDIPAIGKSLDICHGVYLPFFTIEWKSTWTGGTIAAAQVQCARNGAAAVAAMDRLHRIAGLNPSPVDTCHFSLAIDQYLAVFHIHWRWEDADGEIYWEMYEFDTMALRKANGIGVYELRRNLHSIFEFARATRLPRINDCISKISPTTIAALEAPPTVSTSSAGGVVNRSDTSFMQTIEGLGSSTGSAAASSARKKPRLGSQ